MATLRVRYRSGDTDEWDLHERMPLQDLGRTLATTVGPGRMVSFGVASPSGAQTDYGMVGLKLDDIVMWHIDGFVDDEFILSAWAISGDPWPHDPAADD